MLLGPLAKLNQRFTTRVLHQLEVSCVDLGVAIEAAEGFFEYVGSNAVNPIFWVIAGSQLQPPASTPAS